MSSDKLEIDVLAMARDWGRVDAEGFFSRWGIKLEFLESEVVGSGQVVGDILIGSYLLGDEDGGKDHARLLKKGDKIYVGSSVARDTKDILIALLGDSLYSTLSDYPTEMCSEMRTLLAEYTAKSGNIKEYHTDVTEVNYCPDTEKTYRYWVGERRLDSLEIKIEKRASFLYSYIWNYENDWSGARRTERDDLEVIFEDGSREVIRN